MQTATSPTANEITSIAGQLSLMREKVERIKTLLQLEQDKRNKLQNKLMDVMKISGINSIKTNTNIFSLVSKQDARIVDEPALMQDLRSRELAEGLIITKIDSLRFKALARALLKETGELFEGTELNTSEYVSIRNTSKPTDLPTNACAFFSFYLLNFLQCKTPSHQLLIELSNNRQDLPCYSNPSLQRMR